MNLIRTSLGFRILFFTGLLLLIIFTSLFLANSYWQRETTLELIKHNSEESSDLILSAVSEPMRIGDNEGTQEQFVKLHEHFHSLQVYVTNFKGNVTYSTESGANRKDFSELYSDPRIMDRVSKSLKENIREGELFDLNGTPYFTEIRRSPTNQPAIIVMAKNNLCWAA